MHIVAKAAEHRDKLAAILSEQFAGADVISRGRRLFPLELPGFFAVEDDALLGAVTYERHGDEIEVVTLNSFHENRGAGTELLAAVADVARQTGARRLWLVTTNDNIRALRFYQRRGWDLVTVHRNAVNEARKMKPEIPDIGDHDIPILHEIEFELILSAD